MKPLKKQFIIWGSLFYCFSGAAQAAWYQVEVIVFEQQPAMTGELLLPTTPGLPDVTGAIVLPPGKGDRPFELLPSHQYLLTSVANRLNSSPIYRIISHMAWLQPLRRKTTNIRLLDINNNGTNSSLLGSIKIFNQEGTQIKIDVAFHTQPDPTSEPQIFRLTEQRRVRGYELHYFDHPKIGVLVQLSKAKDIL